MPTLFTMNADVYDFTAPDLAGASGLQIHFDLNVNLGYLVVDDTIRPSLVDYRRVVGYIRSDGRMYDTEPVSAAPFDLDDPGSLGVRLLANDHDLNLEDAVTYRVSGFRYVDGSRVAFGPYETASVPSTDITVDLADYLVPEVSETLLTSHALILASVDRYVDDIRGQFRSYAAPVDPEDEDTLWQWRDSTGVDIGDPVDFTDIIPESVAVAALEDSIPDVVPDAVAADLAARNLTWEDAGGGEWQLAAGGSPIGDTTTAPATTWSAVAGRPHLYFTDYGECDGVTNDAAGFTSALSALSSAGGGVLVMPPTDIAMTVTNGTGFGIPANCEVIGTKGATRILIGTDAAGTEDRGFIHSAGDNAQLTGVEMVRQSDFELVFMWVGGYDNFRITGCTFDGQADTYTTYYVHGVALDQAGTKTNTLMDRCTFTKLRYGVTQANATTHTVDGFTVRDCVFTQNYRDDLAFNAPNSTMKNVLVTGCRFSENQYASTGAGIGCGFAHVVNGVVRDCTFEDYQRQPVHAEDYCENIVVSGNTMISGGQAAIATGVNVITGCTRVVISDNVFDSSANSVNLPAIVIPDSGAGTTPGGRAHAVASHVTVSGNIIKAGATTAGMYLQGVLGLTVKGNQLYGSGVVAAGAWGSGLATGYGLYVHGGEHVVIDGNTIQGFQYGMRGGLGTVLALGDPGVIRGNMISDCDFGILAIPAGALNINGNTMENCVRPMLVGEIGSGTAKPCTVTGNFATGCVRLIEVGTALSFKKNGGTNTVGTGKNVAVVDLYRKAPVGTIIVFDGGGTLTVTTAATTTTSLTIVGDVTDASITADDYGVSTNLVHSTTGGNNHILVANNADTVDGVYS